MARPFFVLASVVATSIAVMTLAGGCADVLGADFGRNAAGGDASITSSAIPDGDEDGAATSNGAACETGEKECHGACVRIDDARFGCSATSCTPCAASHGTAACAGANCVVAACEAKRADCNHASSDGCEVDLATDPDHCGACGVACSDAQVCAPTGCASTCPSTLATCGQSCVDTKRNADHCGGCNKGCSAPVHGTATCASSKCDFVCDDGYRRCGGSCVADSVASCGPSCTPCAAPANATPSCANGVCGHACNSGYVPCATGCCAPEAGPPPCTLRTFYQDKDGDGYGSTNTTRECYQPSGFVGITGDCDDGNPTVHPNATTTGNQPYTVTGTTRTSFDYDCDGKLELMTPKPMNNCNSASSGWANGAVCQSSADNGVLCTTSARLADGGTDFAQACGAMYYRCELRSGTSFQWWGQGNIPCQ